MDAPANRLRSKLQSRIISFYSLLLAGILSLTFLIVTFASYQIANQQMSEELIVGQRVFNQLLNQQQQQLRQSATVLTADFGFLGVITLDDPATVLSALINHSHRIGADVMVLFDLDANVTAHTLSNRQVSDFEALRDLFDKTINYSSVSDVILVHDHLYQVVLMPVLAPEPVAWLAIGFLIDNRLAGQLKDITGLEVSFFANDRVRVSTLDGPTITRVESVLRKMPTADPTQLETRQLAGYATLFSPVSEHSEETNLAILQRSPAAITAQFAPVQRTLGGLSLFALVLTIIGSVLIARRITRPINSLADAADRIQDGNYDIKINIDSNDEVGRLGASLQHMAKAVAEREERIRRLAFEDSVTGLPNRALFVRELEQFSRVSRRGELNFSVVFLELDRFKHINETLGYEAGDQVLRHVANLLPDCVRDSDIVGCFGGAEFAILLTMNTPEHINATTSRIESTFATPYLIGDQPIDIGFSIGIAHYPDHAKDAESLLRKADVALQRAQRNRIGIAVYDDEQEHSQQEYLHLYGELREAVEQDQLVLYFQPKLHLQTDRIVAVEALVRWMHPVRGMVPPGLFIPFAEHTGAIRMVTTWVIQSAIAQLRDWQELGINVQVSLNVSTRDLLNPELPDFMRQTINGNGIDPASICIEITESALMEDPETAMNTVTQLSALGVELAIDDYGTGYSSLAYLKNLPVKELKIDREFIMHMCSKPEDLAIVQSTIELGHNLQLKVVAEGVENESEMNDLKALGCDLVQGYYVAKPMPSDEFEQWMGLRETEMEQLNVTASL